MKISPLTPSENQAVADLVRSVILEHGVPKVGTAYADKSLDDLYTYYQQNSGIYYVLKDENGHVVGGAGIAPLENYEGPVCELQKMYFYPNARGLGWGSAMIDQCLSKAREMGYEQCYLETMPQMLDAQKLYLKKGFKYIDGPMGDTGHCSCPIHMLLAL
jgi:putative acetyltransferase